jgi:hypothetical protein
MYVHAPPQLDDVYDDALLEIPNMPAAHTDAVCEEEPAGHQNPRHTRSRLEHAAGATTRRARAPAEEHAAAGAVPPVQNEPTGHIAPAADELPAGQKYPVAAVHGPAHVPLAYKRAPADVP